jgi:hypothetical protein
LAAPACESDATPAVTVHSYIIGATERSRQDLSRLAEESRQASPIARLLGDRLQATADVRVIEPPGGGTP